MNEIMIPKRLMPLIKAFCSDELTVRILIVTAAKTIYATERSLGFSNHSITDDELEGVISLMKGINPQDTIEMIYGAQIITSHLLGLRLLSHGFPADQSLGLKLLRFSNESMQQLQKKRTGGSNQNITVNYNINGQGLALQTIIQDKEIPCQ